MMMMMTTTTMTTVTMTAMITKRLITMTMKMMMMVMNTMMMTGVELRFSKHSPDWRVTQNFYLPNQRKTCQNHVFAEHLYSVH
jgi:hypothetical protein